MTRYSVLLIGLALLLVSGCGGDREPIPESDLLGVGHLLPIPPTATSVPGPDSTTCTEGDSKSLEGTPSCESGPPAGGGCTCKNGTWDCWVSCHETCPYTYDPSIQGTACTFTKDEASCIYFQNTGNTMQMTCDCIDGKLDCQGF